MEKLNALVLDVIEEQVLTPNNVEALIHDSIARLEAHPLHHAAAERDRLDALLVDLDARIRRTAAQVVNGLIDADDAKAMNTPLLEQREHARLQRAALPSPEPPPNTVDPEAFRNAIKEAWHDRPLEDRRQALDKLFDEVRLSPGGVMLPASTSACQAVAVRSASAAAWTFPPAGFTRPSGRPLPRPCRQLVVVVGVTDRLLYEEGRHLERSCADAVFFQHLGDVLEAAERGRSQGQQPPLGPRRVGSPSAA